MSKRHEQEKKGLRDVYNELQQYAEQAEFLKDAALALSEVKGWELTPSGWCGFSALIGQTEKGIKDAMEIISPIIYGEVEETSA